MPGTQVRLQASTSTHEVNILHFVGVGGAPRFHFCPLLAQPSSAQTNHLEFGL